MYHFHYSTFPPICNRYFDRRTAVKQILCLSNQPWSSSPGRTQQLLSRLRDTQILYFSPAADRRDHSWRESGKKVRPNVTVYTLPPLLLGVGERFGPLFRAEHRRQSAFVREKAARHRFSSPLLWVTSPEHVHMLDELSYDGLVYDCDREWSAFPPHWEGTLAHAADVVFAASPLLAEQLSPCSSNIVLLPNGVNYPLFSGQGGTDSGRLLSQVRGPVFGWAGTITPELDLSPILAAAREYPEWTFLLLGRREGNPLMTRLQSLPNVRFAGPCPLSEVPDWLFRCDVLVDVLHQDRSDDGVVSARLYEYLSTGKPVVSMLWPDQVELFPDVVYGSYTEGEFISMCLSALEEAPGFVSQRRRAHGKSAAWSARAGEVSRILTTAGLL